MCCSLVHAYLGQAQTQDFRRGGEHVQGPKGWCQFKACFLYLRKPRFLQGFLFKRRGGGHRPQWAPVGCAPEFIHQTFHKIFRAIIIQQSYISSINLCRFWWSIYAIQSHEIVLAIRHYFCSLTLKQQIEYPWMGEYIGQVLFHFRPPMG